jgi:hypothetical protein
MLLMGKAFRGQTAQDFEKFYKYHFTGVTKSVFLLDGGKYCHRPASIFYWRASNIQISRPGQSESVSHQQISRPCFLLVECVALSGIC